MNIDLVKESIKINEVAELFSSEVLTEGDVILPDSSPDIFNILQIDGRAVVKSREAQAGKITISGEAEFVILYLPEPAENDVSVKSIKHVLSFTDVCEATNSESDLKVSCSADVSHIEYNIVNSRKLNIKAVIALDLKACRQKETELVCDALSDENLMTRKKTINAYSLTVDDEFKLVIPDKLEIPSGKPAISEILKVDASVTGEDVRVITGKAIIKGTINVCTLYNGIDPGDQIQFVEHEIPFTEILDIPDAVENMECDIEYNVDSIYYEADFDNEEEEGARVMGVEVTMTAFAAAANSTTVLVLDDCYSPDYSIELTKKMCSVEHIASNTKNQAPVRGTLTLPDELPEIAQVYNVVAKPYVNEVSTEGENTVVSGVLDVYILYLTADKNMPVYSYKQELPFTYTEETGQTERSSVECLANIVNCSYNLANERSVEIRANIMISLKLIVSDIVAIIENISAEEAPPSKKASIIICFAQQGDTLWDIAKRYRTTMAKIAAANEISEDSPIEGRRLLIPKA